MNILKKSAKKIVQNESVEEYGDQFHKNSDYRLSTDVEVTSSSPNDKRTQKLLGYVSAYPNEFLIHYRGGKFREKSSGHGAQCFKFPGDTVIIIPTSLKQIVFQANQLTADNVDLRVRGIVIYQIFDPLKINSKINFFNRQSAENKLARMVGDLCRSIVKWLIANMKVEECIRKRKEDIADALKREITLVVADDYNSWGIEIVTIDVQDVYIQDKDIFQALQTLFKSEKMRQSELCQLDMTKALEIKKLDVDAQIAERRKDQKLRNIEIEAEIENKKAEMELQSLVQDSKLELSRIKSEEEQKTYLEEQELERKRQKGKQEFEFSQMRYKEEIERRQQENNLELENNRLRVEADNLAKQMEIEILRNRMEVENSITPSGLEKNFIEVALPKIAEALAASMTNSNINIIQGQGDINTPFRLMLFEITEILKERLNNVKKNNKLANEDISELSNNSDNE